MIGRYASAESTVNRRVYQNGTYCAASRARRRGEVRLRCCPQNSESTADASVFISSVYEPTPCHYIFDVCMQCLCDTPMSMNHTKIPAISAAQVSSLRQSATSLFYHSYRAYVVFERVAQEFQSYLFQMLSLHHFYLFLKFITLILRTFNLRSNTGTCVTGIRTMRSNL